MHPSPYAPEMPKSLLIQGGLGTVNVGNMLALPGFKIKEPKAAKKLPNNADELIVNVLETLDSFVVSALEARTAAEFRGKIDEVFPPYFETVLGLSHILRSVVPKNVLEAMSEDSFSNAEADFRDNGLAIVGADVQSQAVFTTWTLRKINNLCRQINSIPLEADLTEENRALFEQFLYHAMCTRFSLDCLSKAISLKKPIYPEVLPIILDGLRNAVNAYAYVVRGLELRKPSSAMPDTHVDWDEEDQELLEEANFDLLEEAIA